MLGSVVALAGSARLLVVGFLIALRIRDEDAASTIRSRAGTREIALVE